MTYDEGRYGTPVDAELVSGDGISPKAMGRLRLRGWANQVDLGDFVVYDKVTSRRYGYEKDYDFIWRRINKAKLDKYIKLI